MEITFQRDDILPSLASLAKISSERAVIPILSHLFIRSGSFGTELFANNATVQVGIHTEDMATEEGTITVPAGKFHDIFRALRKNSEVTIKEMDRIILIRSGKSKFELPTLPAQDYPFLDWKVSEMGTCDAPSFLQALQTASVSMGVNDVQAFMNGVSVEISGESIRFVATDRHRLSLAEIPFSPTEENDIHYQGILPRKAVLEIAHLFSGEGDMKISAGPVAMQFIKGGTNVICKLIDSKYPDIRKIIPNYSNHFTVGMEDLQSALQQANTISSTKNNPSCTFNLRGNSLFIQSRNEENAKSDIEIEVETQGKDLEIVLNHKYIMELQSVIAKGDILIEYQDSASSIVLREKGNQNSFHLIMPIRL